MDPSTSRLLISWTCPSLLDNSFLGKSLITSSNFLASLQIIFNLEYAKLIYFYLLSILGRREFLDVSRIRIVLSIPNIIKNCLHVCAREARLYCTDWLDTKGSAMQEKHAVLDFAFTRDSSETSRYSFCVPIANC